MRVGGSVDKAVICLIRSIHGFPQKLPYHKINNVCCSSLHALCGTASHSKLLTIYVLYRFARDGQEILSLTCATLPFRWAGRTFVFF